LIIEIRSLDRGFLYSVTPTDKDLESIDCDCYVETWEEIVERINELKWR